jgi:predicted transcriptional regulator
VRPVVRDVLTAIAEAQTQYATTAQLVQKTGLPSKLVSRACQALLSRGLASHRERGHYGITPVGRELLTAGKAITSGPSGPNRYHRDNKQTLRERIWRALSLSGKATINDLLNLAAAGTERDARCNARKYLTGLERAGYTIRMGKKEPGVAATSNGFPRWMLVKETGPKAPVVNLKRNVLFDPNTEEEIALCRTHGRTSSIRQSTSTARSRRSPNS